MTIKQSPLPYDIDALEPHVSGDTLAVHYGKHHSGYIDKLNKLIDDTPYAGMDLEQVISTARRNADIDILNNAEQAWNHAFLWESMTPDGGEMPDGEIRRLIENQFGSFEKFRDEFRSAAIALFGSGWVWLVLDGDKLRILTTSNADSPVATDMLPLLVLDVWEHAYYLDYKNERKRYVENFLDKLINWKFAAANMEKTRQSKAA